MTNALFTTPAARALGHDFEVVTTDLALTDYLGELFGSLPHAGPEPRHRYELRDPESADRWQLTFDGRPVVSDVSPARALDTLLWRINRGVIDDTDDLVLLHAGAVEFAGVQILLPGDTEVGKSTLVTGLLRAGAGYFSDEVVGLDLDADDMHGYAKAVSLDPGSWPLFPELAPPGAGPLSRFVQSQWHVAPERVTGAEVVRRGIPDVVVLPRFSEGDRTDVRPVGGAAALGLLAASTFKTALPRRVRLARLARLVETTPCFELTYGTLEAAVDALTALAAEIAVGDPDEGVTDAGRRAATSTGADARLRPRSDARLVRVEAEAVVYEDDEGPLLGLNPTGLLVWERLDGERPLGEVIDELATRFGCPAQQVADDVIRFASDLLDRQLLVPTADS